MQTNRTWHRALVALAALGVPALATGDGKGGIAGEVSASPAKYRAGVVVHLDKVEGKFAPPSGPVQIDQKGLKFSPHVLAVLRGTTVKFVNSDNVTHNVFSPDGDKYDLGTWAKGESRTFTFDKPGAFVQLCKIHPEMLAYVVVVDNPYFAVTGDDGRFAIDGVPPGNYTLRAWSERLAEGSQPVTVAAGGRAEVRFQLKR